MTDVAQKSLQRCSLYFGALSVLLAMLIALGTGSWELLALVLVSVAIGYIYTDVLGWFSLPKLVVYILMIGGAIFAAVQFLREGGFERINAVGDLLIYVQLPLIFQKKNKRVFEQWGIFLLLELVVSALVNSDILFGLIMIPILLIGIAALMSLASFSYLENQNRSQTVRKDIWAAIATFMGREALSSSAQTGIALTTDATQQKLSSTKEWNAQGGRIRFGSLVLGLGILLFTAAYFYMVPRMSVGAFEVSEWGNASVGISEQISLRYRGRIKQNDTPVLRMQLLDKRTKSVFVPVQPPYIRVTVLQHYLEGPTRGLWQKGEPGVFPDFRAGIPLPVQNEISRELAEVSDPIIVSISEKTSLRESVAVIPPFSEVTKRKSFIVSRKDWRLMDSSDDVRMTAQKRDYSFQTYAFLRSSEKRVLPSYQDTVLREYRTPILNRNSLPNWDELTSFPASLSPILPFRDTLLENCTAPPIDKLGRALHLEQQLAYNPEFTYSLRQSPPHNHNLDPIADFLLYRKVGHCEYYASALAMLFRSMNIPSRIILGFRPMDYNEIGGYFTVRQDHAHAWVEAYFTLEQIKRYPQFEAQLPKNATSGAWVRFDPTPAAEDSNAGVMFRVAEGQTLSVIEDFWNEMIMNMDRSRQSSMMDVFGEASESSYLKMWEDFQTWLSELRSHPFLEILSSPRNWFSWKAAATIFTLGGFSLAFYHIWSWFFPNWSLVSLRQRKRKRVYEYGFYNKLLQALRRLGIEPKVGQTPKEFWTETAQLLRSHSIHIDSDLITNSFYDLRYGNLIGLEPEREHKIEQQLQLIQNLNRQQLFTSS